MRRTLRTMVIPAALVAAAYGQTPAEQRSKLEFDAASIRVNPPRVGFHFASDSMSGGPGSEDPGLFRCTNCTLATLIAKAFDLQNYQFPGRGSLGDNNFDVMAKIPAGTTPEEFRAMLQNLLKERFGLRYSFKEKTVRGYHLEVGKNGPKLKESTDDPKPAAPKESAGQHGAGQWGGHSRNGLMVFGSSATFRNDHQTTADLAKLLGDQLSLPVDDQTGLKGKYDISLNWSGQVAHSGSGNHGDGGGFGGGGGGGAGHGDHGGGAPGGGAGGSAFRQGDGPTLFEAVQSQLGLKLSPSAQTVARIFVIEHVDQLPTAN